MPRAWLYFIQAIHVEMALQEKMAAFSASSQTRDKTVSYIMANLGFFNLIKVASDILPDILVFVSVLVLR